MNKWKTYLNNTNETKYNVAHLSAMSDLDSKKVAQYVDRCIAVAEKNSTNLSPEEKKIAIRTLQWMDVAKCGTDVDRALWKSTINGICLDVHNEASAEIYMKYSDDGDDEITKNTVYALIKTHGLIGQYLMGECDLRAHRIFTELNIAKPSLFKILKVINHAILAGVSNELWKENNIKINAAINCVINNIYKIDQPLSRLQRLFPAFANVEKLTDEEYKLYAKIFSKVSLWYPSVALHGFARNELNTIFKAIDACDLTDISHVSFYDFAKELSYDRNGVRKENVYKKRIVEVLLREIGEGIDNTCEKEHVELACVRDGNCLQFQVKFTPVCLALINFCVEAERSGFANYQKNIITIFDMFGFRRDIFDRLSNEEVYLETMNNTQASTKLNILDYIRDDSRSIVDVGSGGGVLLDALEKRFPDKTIVGTDISQNVIEVLQKKIDTEGHRYKVWKHNFVDDTLWSPVDNILFSSIMHEIYSYTEMDGEKFNLVSVCQALLHAYNSLNNGGRIIIRDGVKTASDRIVSVRIKDEDTMVLARNYLRDFEGLKELRNEDGQWNNVIINDNVITAHINIIREMLYTITWGPMSYPMEVQEQFGYLTLSDYCAMLESMRMHIIDAKEFTEPGYPEHLNDQVELIDFAWDDIPSNCIIVAEKN